MNCKDQNYIWICKKCSLKFNTLNELKIHYKQNPDHRKVKIYGLFECPFCGLKKETTKEGMTKHIKFCKYNPNAKNFPKKQISIQTRQKQSLSRKKAFAEGRITRTGWLDRQKHKRSVAEIWLKWYIDNNCSDLNYREDYPIKNYLLDFAWPEKQICIEMDGEQHYIDQNQYESDRRKDKLLLELGWKVLRIRWKECQIDKDQFKNIIFNFVEKSMIVPYEKRYKSKKDLMLERRKDYDKRKRTSNTELQRRLDIIKQYLPFRFGWINKCAKENNLTITQIKRTCNIFNLEYRTKQSGVAQK